MSTNQIPALFKLNILKGLNLDFGGGESDAITNHLTSQGVINKVYDPFARSDEHNAKVMSDFDSFKFDSITCVNVLDTLNDSEREQVIKTLHNMCETGEVDKVFIQGGDTQEISKVFIGWDMRLIESNIIELSYK